MSLFDFANTKVAPQYFNPGKHVVRIVSMEAAETSNGNPMLKMTLQDDYNHEVNARLIFSEKTATDQQVNLLQMVSGAVGCTINEARTLLGSPANMQEVVNNLGAAIGNRTFGCVMSGQKGGNGKVYTNLYTNKFRQNFSAPDRLDDLTYYEKMNEVPDAPAIPLGDSEWIPEEVGLPGFN